MCACEPGFTCSRCRELELVPEDDEPGCWQPDGVAEKDAAFINQFTREPLLDEHGRVRRVAVPREAR